MSIKIDLKTTILLASLTAVGLNVMQFCSSYQQRERAFVPAWATTSATPSPAPAGIKAAVIAKDTRPSTTEATAPIISTADPVAAATAKLQAAGLKADFASLYLSVQQRTGTPWQLLAAVHQVETGQSSDTSRSSYAGATGPMQFMPATFAHYALDGDGNGTRDIHDLDDAMLTAGRYLAAGGADKGNYSTALYNYNHSWSYVYRVSGIAKRLGLP